VVCQSSDVGLYLNVGISVQWKFIHFHGQKTPRLDRTKSIYEGDCHKCTIPFWLLSLILFFSPDVHLRDLSKVWTDELVIEEVWKNFMDKLVSEWVEFVLYVSNTRLLYLEIQKRAPH